MPVIHDKESLYRVVREAGEPSGVIFPSSTHSLIQLELPDNVYVLPVDFYRFSDLLYFMEEGTTEELEVAKHGLFRPNGRNGVWELMCGHIPYIDPAWVVQII